MGLVSSSNRLSRPMRTQRTTPASSRTRRCLVTACRVSLVPTVRREIDCGCPLVSLTSTDRRVSSPRAANTDARVFNTPDRLWRLPDILCDVFQLSAPAALVHAKRLLAASAWQLVKPRLDDPQRRSFCRRLQGELNERRWLFAIILVGIHGVRVPSEREQSLRFHFLHDSLPPQVLVPRIGDPSTRDLARYEWAFESNAEPLAEFLVISQRSPDAGDGSVEFDGLFDAIGHAQPPSCT